MQKPEEVNKPKILGADDEKQSYDPKKLNQIGLNLEVNAIKKKE